MGKISIISQRIQRSFLYYLHFHVPIPGSLCDFLLRYKPSIQAPISPDHHNRPDEYLYAILYGPQEAICEPTSPFPIRR